MEISHTEKLLFERTLEKLSQAERALGEARMDMHMLLLKRQQLSAPEQSGESVGQSATEQQAAEQRAAMPSAPFAPAPQPPGVINPAGPRINPGVPHINLRIHLSNPRRSRDPQFNQRLCTVHKQILSHPSNHVRKRTRFFRRVPDGGHRNRSL